ncbi:hypothetical protein A6I91_01695 [Prescottella equi]|nr:hypothetical protein A6I91_01695 [Prescottella equi]
MIVAFSMYFVMLAGCFRCGSQPSVDRDVFDTSRTSAPFFVTVAVSPIATSTAPRLFKLDASDVVVTAEVFATLSAVSESELHPVRTSAGTAMPTRRVRFMPYE